MTVSVSACRTGAIGGNLKHECWNAGKELALEREGCVGLAGSNCVVISTWYGQCILATRFYPSSGRFGRHVVTLRYFDGSVGGESGLKIEAI